MVKVSCDNCRKEIHTKEEGRDIRVIAGEVYSAARMLCKTCEDKLFDAFFGRRAKKGGK
jgi:hypothetical protein